VIQATSEPLAKVHELPHRTWVATRVRNDSNSPVVIIAVLVTSHHPLCSTARNQLHRTKTVTMPALFRREVAPSTGFPQGL
jgi:hypothetical protein